MSQFDDPNWRRSLGKAEKQLARRTFSCLHPGCSATAIQSHSQQRANQLASIAVNDEVYALQRNAYRALGRGTPLLVEKIRIANASTAPAFCRPHDAALFREIEQRRFDLHERTALLISLRSFAYEVAQKRLGAARLSLWQTELADYMDGEMLGHLEKSYEQFVETDGLPGLADLVSASEGHGTLNVTFEEIPRNLGISSATTFCPLLEDFDSWRRANIDARQPLVTVSMLPSLAATRLVMCGDDRALGELFARKPYPCQADQAEEWLNWVAFVESEDTCISPALWESTSEEERARALEAMRHTMWRGHHAQTPKIVR